MSIRKISPREAQNRLDSGKNCLMVDVRTGAEFGRVHVEGSVLAPVQSLDGKRFVEEHPEARDCDVLLMCQSGTRARMAADALVASGVKNVCVVDGGISAWEREGLPVVRREVKMIGVERQTRIVIGLGVLGFTALGVLVHPGFLGGAAFFGLGLVMAGITDKCPLSLLIAAMPWNKGCASCAAPGQKTTS